MADNENIEPVEERGLKWKELEVRVQHYKHYITIALQANVFYYVTTGGVLAFYLKYTQVSESQLPIPDVEFFLLLPILFGSVLGGIFFYGARLQVKAVENLDDVRDELRNRLGLNVRKLHDSHLLVILLRIFGFIFFLVVAALLILPFLLGRISASKLLSFETLLKLSNVQLFYIAAIIILVLGIGLPFIGKFLEGRLKKRRNLNWLKTIIRAKLWLKANESKEWDISELKRQKFYYSLRPFLDKKTIESIDNFESMNNDERILAKSRLTKKATEFYGKLEHTLELKTIEKIEKEVESEEKERLKKEQEKGKELLEKRQRELKEEQLSEAGKTNNNISQSEVKQTDNPSTSENTGKV